MDTDSEMNLTANKLARNEEVLKSRLRHWFRFDHLRPAQGIALLLCFALDNEDERDVVDWGDNNEVRILRLGVPLLNGNKMCSWLELEPNEECAQLDAIDCTQQDQYLFSREHSRTIFGISVQQHRRLLQYWASGKHPELTPLKYFIEWARKKGVTPEWTATAAGLGLLQEETLISDGNQLENIPAYSAGWLTIQQAAIAHFFNPRHDYDAKRDEVVEWIKQRAKEVGLLDSDNVARSMFTIIKPANHNPKKKRVEPQ